MTLDLSRRRVLVTGGTRGIGREIVLTLARAGSDVVTCHRHAGDAADSLGRELKEIGDNHHILRVDVTQPAEVRWLVEECRTRFGSLDVVVNNAGAITHTAFADLPPEEWAMVLDTNLTGSYLVIQHTLPLMGPGASIVNVGSRVATIGVPLRAHYTAAKAGIIGLTRSLAKELGPRGIRVNVVAPGPIETEATPPPDVRRRYEQLIPLGRLGRTAEVANVVLFLASNLSSFVNGETIHVDGGI